MLIKSSTNSINVKIDIPIKRPKFPPIFPKSDIAVKDGDSVVYVVDRSS